MKFVERHINMIAHAICDCKGCPFTCFSGCEQCPFEKSGSPNDCAILDPDAFEYIKALLLSEVPDTVELTDNELLELKHMLINRDLTKISRDREVAIWYAEDNHERELLVNRYEGLDPKKVYDLKALVEVAEESWRGK